MIAWMLYSLVVGALLALAAVAAERGARRLGLAGRWAWAAAIVLTLAVCATAFWRPGGAETAGERPVLAEAALEATVVDPSALAASDAGLLDTMRRRADAIATRLGAVLDRVLDESAAATRRLAAQTWLERAAMIAWLLASLTVAGVIGVAAHRLARARRAWGLGVVNEQFVRVSDDVGPAVVGFVRGEIVVPEWALELPPDRRAMLLAHECEHLRARDPVLLLGALVALVLMPWNPALWWQVRRLRLAVEMDCDRRVLRRGSDVRAYGALLIEVGRRAAQMPLAAAAFSEPATHLERRIHMMLARPPRWRALRAAALALVGGAIVFVACDMQPPVAPEPEREVALAELARADVSYNVKERLTPAALREALSAHHPELLRDQGGRQWTVFLVYDSAGRLIDTHKSEIEELRVLAPKRRPPGPPNVVMRADAEVPANIVVRANDGQVESVEVERRAAVALREKRRVESGLVMLQADSMRISGDWIELRPAERRATVENARITGELVELRPAARRAAYPDTLGRDQRAARERAVVEAQALVRARRPLEASAGSPDLRGLERVRPEDIESIEIIKGGVFADFAPALQGVIVVRKK